MIGTPAYMAPEQLNGGPVDARADVFAFGAVLYEYISGVHPFAAATPLATIARVLESDARPLGQHCPHAPAAVLECVERCLRKAPDERFRVGGRDRAGARARRRTGRPARRHTPGGGCISSSSSRSISSPPSLGWQIKEWVNDAGDRVAVHRARRRRGDRRRAARASRLHRTDQPAGISPSERRRAGGGADDRRRADWRWRSSPMRRCSRRGR